MAGHLRERSPGTWELRAYAGRDPVSRRKVYRTRTFKGGERQAAKALAAFVTELEGGHASTSGTFGELVNRYVEHRSDGWSPNTLDKTRWAIDAYLEPLMGRPLSKLRTADLDAFYGTLRRSGGKDGAPLAASSVARLHVIVRAALEQGCRWGWLTSNPARYADPGQIDETEVVPPTAEELLALFEAAQRHDPELVLFLILAALLGARRGELSALRWTDFDDTSVTIKRVIVLGPDGPVERRKTSRSKKGKPRRLAVDAGTMTLLAAHRKRSAEHALACGVGLPAGGFVFAAEPDGSRPWRPDTWTHRFSRLRKQVGLERVRLHDLRHFVATALLDGGIGLPTVAGRMGHADGGKTTLGRYSHFQPVTDQAAAEMLADLLRRPSTSA